MKQKYVISIPLLLLIIFDALLAGALTGYIGAFLQWWNR